MDFFSLLVVIISGCGLILSAVDWTNKKKGAATEGFIYFLFFAYSFMSLFSWLGMGPKDVYLFDEGTVTTEVGTTCYGFRLNAGDSITVRKYQADYPGVFNDGVKTVVIKNGEIFLNELTEAEKKIVMDKIVMDKIVMDKIVMEKGLE